MELPRGRSVEQEIARAGQAIRLVLLYGPDSGLAHERASGVLAAQSADPGDAFRVSRLTGAQIAEDPARLADEAAALCFIGGRRIVWISDVSNSLGGKAIAGYLENPLGEALIVVEAGDLSSKSSLRAAVKASSIAFLVPCYLDNEGNVGQVVRDALQASGLSASPDAVQYLIDHLGSDRLVSRSELDKLMLYCADRGRIELHDAMASIGDNAAISIEDVIAATASGDHAALDRAIEQAFADGETSVGLIRATMRHFQRLHLVLTRVAAGLPALDAVARLEPKPFGPQRDRLVRQAGLWTPRLAARALSMLLDAELRSKSTGLPEHAIASDALMGVSRLLRSRNVF